MGTTGAAVRVDGAVLREAAATYDAIGDLLAVALRNQLSDIRFGADSAGRDYGREGAALDAALDDLTVAIRLWSRAAHEVAGALRGSADRYAEAELQAAGRVG